LTRQPVLKRNTKSPTNFASLIQLLLSL